MFFSICYEPGTVLEAGVQQQMKQSLYSWGLYFICEMTCNKQVVKECMK